MIEQIVVIALIGTLLTIDVTLAGQMLLSRPLVVLSLIGLYMGDTLGGFLLGAILELLCADMLPLGVVIPLDTAVMSTVAGSVYFMGNYAQDMKSRTLALMCAFVTGVLFRRYDIWFKKNTSFVFNYFGENSDDLYNTIRIAVVSNISVTFMRNFMFMILSIGIALFLKGFVFEHIYGKVFQGLKHFDDIVPFLAIAVMISTFRIKKQGDNE